ncbi:hypothetical protein QS257_02495 [Terrilactibacillus sp. S3-3]|nr:hypothetical protein QS257_02495 [Terrilactibacillus sp. S3-3]
MKKENWTKLGAAGKYVKGAGIVGTGLTVYSDVEKYSKKTPTPVNFMKMSTDIGVDLTAGATATGVGAAVGAAFLGPVGAVVGAAAGAFASWLLYRKFGKLGNKSITGLAKETLNKEDQKITSWLK